MSETTLKTYQDYLKIKGRARTGSLLLDLVVGGGEGLGFPYGRMINIVGDKSSGKTFLANEIVAAAHYQLKDKLKINYDDTETGYTFNTEKLYGVDIMGDLSEGLESETVEKLNGNIQLFLDRVKPANHGIYVVDALDGLSDDEKEKMAEKLKKAAESDKKVTEGSYNTGTASHLSKQFFRTLTRKLDRKKVLLTIISQVREKLNAGMFEKKVYRAGGKAMDFYAHTCLWLYTLHKIKKNGRVIGVVVKAATEKSKTPRPFRECVFTLYFDYGIDDIGSCLDFLYDLRGDDFKLKGAANNIEWTGGQEDKPIKTFDNMIGWFREKEWYDEARKARKEREGKSALSAGFMDEWLKEFPDRLKETENHFAEVFTRRELIKRIEQDKDMKKVLYSRVVEKWEQLEFDATEETRDRARKYG